MSSLQQPYKRCYETHPPLPLSDGLVVYGGSCGHPVVLDADIYIGFDLSMWKTNRRYPWEPGEEVLFHIRDMTAPEDPVAFKKLIEWVSVQLAAQKKVHMGCIGGHGRTGTALAALVKEMMGEEDAITYVRENYCKKVVESEAQIKFLHKHFGIKKVVPTKTFSAPKQQSGWSSGYRDSRITEVGGPRKPFKFNPPKKELTKSSTERPVVSAWGENAKFD